jgi:hypothetical protein
LQGRREDSSRPQGRYPLISRILLRRYQFGDINLPRRHHSTYSMEASCLLESPREISLTSTKNLPRRYHWRSSFEAQGDSSLTSPREVSLISISLGDIIGHLDERRNVSLEHRLFYRALLQKRLIIVKSLLIVATPFSSLEAQCLIESPGEVFLISKNYRSLFAKGPYKRDDIRQKRLIILRSIRTCQELAVPTLPHSTSCFLIVGQIDGCVFIHTNR